MATSAATQEVHFVIGGSGFLGSSIVRLLKQRGESNVIVFDKISPRSPIEKVKYTTGDLTSADSLSSALRASIEESNGKDVVIYHTASPIADGLDKNIYENVNVKGTKNILQVAKKEGVRAVIFTSSAGVVFDGRDLIHVDERMPYPNPAMDPYNDTKARAEQLVINANEEQTGGLKTCAIRPAGIFGPNDRQALPGFFKVLETGKQNFQIGDNTNLFDWTYVDNVAHAHLLAADKISLSPGYSVENLATEHLTPVSIASDEVSSLRKVPNSEDRISPPGAKDYAADLPSTLSDETRELDLNHHPVMRNRFNQFFHLVHPELPTAGSPLPEFPLVADHLKIEGEVFFVTNGQPIPFWDFPRSLWKNVGFKLDEKKVWKIPTAIGLPLAAVLENAGWVFGKKTDLTRYKVTYSTAIRYYNIEKARRVLGYEPLVGLDEGVKRSAEWWMSEHPEQFASKSG